MGEKAFTRRRAVGVWAFAAAVACAFVMLFAGASTAWAAQFNDVEGHWAQTSGVIDRAADAGIVKGIENADGSVSFQPDGQVTRAQVAVMLCRMAGAEDGGAYPADTTGMADAVSYTWFTQALNWACDNGIMTGSGNYVRPDDPITRQELAATLSRYYSRFVTSITTYDVDRFTKYSDAGQIASWAKDVVGWCVEYGVMGAGTTLNPEGNATRAESAKMLLVVYDGGDKQPNLMKAHYIDVGQGSSTFIELPSGKTLLIDAGGANASSSVVNEIAALGYSRIDYVVLTHPDADHVGGMQAVLNRFSIGTIYTTGKTSDTQTWQNLAAALEASTANKETASCGVTIESAAEYASFLGPQASAVTSASTNDSSAITSIAYGSTKWLYPGDASSGVILSSVSGHYDVLNVAHHGSSTGTNTAVIAALTPSWAVISCGVNNTYGYPTSAVLSALGSTPTLRTDQCGTVDMYTDSKSIWSTAQAKTDASVSDGEGSANNAGGSSSAGNSGSSGGGESGGSSSVGGGTDNTYTVYITNTGKKYHVLGCRFLKNSCIAIGLDAAKSQGYTACSVCKPAA